MHISFYQGSWKLSLCALVHSFYKCRDFWLLSLCRSYDSCPEKKNRSGHNSTRELLANSENFLCSAALPQAGSVTVRLDFSSWHMLQPKRSRKFFATCVLWHVTCTTQILLIPLDHLCPWGEKHDPGETLKLFK